MAVDPNAKMMLKALARILNEVPARNRNNLEEELTWLLSLVGMTLKEASFLVKARPWAFLMGSQSSRPNRSVRIEHLIYVIHDGQELGPWRVTLEELSSFTGLTIGSLNVYRYRRGDRRTGAVRLRLPEQDSALSYLEWFPQHPEGVDAFETIRNVSLERFLDWWATSELNPAVAQTRGPRRKKY